MTRFEESFETSARRIRWRLASRIVLRYAGLGSIAAALLAAVLWWSHAPVAPAWSLVTIGAAVLLGQVVAHRRRWSDGDIALFLDSRLESKEAISAAVELRGKHEATPEVRSAVMRDAAAAFERRARHRIEPGLYERWHWTGVLGVMGVLAATLVPARAVPKRPDPPGKELVKRDALAGLDRVMKLRELDLRDPEQRRKLDALANRAQKLQSSLKQGLEKREALAQLAELQDHLRGERLSLSDAANRAGLEAAVGALESGNELDRAARAIGNGDVSAFDREMQRLANLAEREARDTAKALLGKAADAASRRGAHDVSRLLEEQRRLFEGREDRARMLRELAHLLDRQLDDEARKALERFERTGDPEAQRALTEALLDALGELDDGQRKKLAENLKDPARRDGDLEPMTREELERLARELSTDEGKQRLAESLKELAEETPSDAARRDRALEDAERGADTAQREIGGLVPMPTESHGDASGSQDALPQARKPSGSRDTGTHEPNGNTLRVEGETLRSKAPVALNPAIPLQGSEAGRAPARTGETANQRGVGGLTAAGPEQIQAVERSEIPTEYRNQVGRYFEPR